MCFSTLCRPLATYNLFWVNLSKVEMTDLQAHNAMCQVELVDCVSEHILYMCGLCPYCTSIIFDQDVHNVFTVIRVPMQMYGRHNVYIVNSSLVWDAFASYNTAMLHKFNGSFTLSLHMPSPSCILDILYSSKVMYTSRLTFPRVWRGK